MQPGLLEDLDLRNAEEVQGFVDKIDRLQEITGKSKVLYTDGFSVSATTDLLIFAGIFGIFSTNSALFRFDSKQAPSDLRYLEDPKSTCSEAVQGRDSFPPRKAHTGELVLFSHWHVIFEAHILAF